MSFFNLPRRHRFLIGAAFCVLALSAFAFGHPALAQTLSATDQLNQVATGGGLPTVSAPIIIARIIRVVLGTLGIIFTIVVLYAGFIYMTAQGDDTKIKTAKAMIKNGIIGLILCLLSFTITTYILDRLVEAAGLTGGSTSVTSQYGEPLSGSLGAGIIESTYPERDAIDIPRNTRIYVTFKEPIDPASIIAGYDANPASTDLNTDNVSIGPTDSTVGSALASTDVIVTTNDDHTIFAFDPVPNLGSSVEDTNYTVTLGSGIQKSNGLAAFSGAYSDGYRWSFEVSTLIDLTPPTVVSVIPRSGADEARNVTVSITFSEAMDPVASTGTSPTFRNIEVAYGDDVASATNEKGTFAISNGYRTVEFTPDEACGQDPCGDTIYCLHGNETIFVTAHAATLGTDPPQAYSVSATFDGLVDAAANSLDGNDDGEAQGSRSDDVDGTDDYELPSFTTTDDLNDDVPHIADMSAGINEGLVDQDADLDITFDIPMKSSTLNSANISLWPDPWYEFWFSLSKTDHYVGDDVDYTVANVSHGTLVSPDDLGWNYWPTVTRGVKSNWQICMYPAYGPSAEDAADLTCNGGSYSGDLGVSSALPYCCNGVPQATACETGTTQTSTGRVDAVGNPITLPDSND
ncbi:hypothetical protein EBS80_02175 [bacterium]|nr:hypothetical protein [bacterium]